ncbi:Regenerating islet-derived protein 3-gamma [Galemys pyrenaicus]|uniref:Regenerating islet-derived protein 3-gamma n=1 Tax=Galemys pyrenaicus TaxID=202257 RepID=A0A8J6AGC6_GALPY|nr:Regenerating islet-derived protein 3-gamma [Galemys pyrenaicus]
MLPPMALPTVSWMLLSCMMFFSQVQGRMLPPMALPTVSWMLLSCMMFFSQVQGENLQEEEPSSRINCPAGSMAFSFYCYALYQEGKTWMEADLDCQNRHLGHLTSVLSGSEASFVATLIKNSGSKSPFVWIGLHDPTENQSPNGGGWKWINNDLLQYRAWDTNPPPCSYNGYCGSVSEHTGKKLRSCPLSQTFCPLLPPYVIGNGKVITVISSYPMSASSETRVVRSVSLRSVSCTLLSCLMLVAQAQGAVLKNAQSSPRNGCPSGSMAYASHCYALFQTTKSWMDANMDCQRQESGHLVSVLSGSEASFVAALIRNSGISQSYVWIGLHDPTEGSRPNAGGWEWSNSAILNYRAWERNPPTSPSSGYCGSVSRTSNFKKWKDYDCEANLPYVCKFKN